MTSIPKSNLTDLFANATTPDEVFLTHLASVCTRSGGRSSSLQMRALQVALEKIEHLRETPSLKPYFDELTLSLYRGGLRHSFTSGLIHDAVQSHTHKLHHVALEVLSLPHKHIEEIIEKDVFTRNLEEKLKHALTAYEFLGYVQAAKEKGYDYALDDQTCVRLLHTLLNQNPSIEALHYFVGLTEGQELLDYTHQLFALFNPGPVPNLQITNELNLFYRLNLSEEQLIAINQRQLDGFSEEELKAISRAMILRVGSDRARTLFDANQVESAKEKIAFRIEKALVYLAEEVNRRSDTASRSLNYSFAHQLASIGNHVEAAEVMGKIPRSFTCHEVIDIIDQFIRIYLIRPSAEKIQCFKSILSKLSILDFERIVNEGQFLHEVILRFLATPALLDELIEIPVFKKLILFYVSKKSIHSFTGAQMDQHLERLVRTPRVLAYFAKNANLRRQIVKSLVNIDTQLGLLLYHNLSSIPANLEDERMILISALLKNAAVLARVNEFKQREIEEATSKSYSELLSIFGEEVEDSDYFSGPSRESSPETV